VSARIHHSGLVLSGGGARGAYQAGALIGLARVLGKQRIAPFRVVCGTSAGAINAAMIASHADDFRNGVARLARLWRGIRVTDVYRADLRTLSRHGLQFLAAAVGTVSAPKRAASMLDNAPLAGLLDRVLDLRRIAGQIDRGALVAIGVNATSYATGKAVTFFQARPDRVEWQRTRRLGQRCTLTTAHLMASTAIPFIFPAVGIDDDFYMDGSVRQVAPLSPALHLGARRIVVVGTGRFGGQQSVQTGKRPEYPSFAQVTGHALSSIFLDNLGADLERLTHMNRLVGLLPPARLAQNRLQLHHVDALVLAPSIDLGALSLRYADRLPAGVRALLRGFGSTRGSGANLLSYLLFDEGFCRALLRQGYHDTLARRDEIVPFLDPRRSRLVPLNWEQLS
jgi:NTE family protein